ncbi:MAG: hypothetical protein K1000chlam4_00640, partial [Chlamydiae bacterium]|nr:hypothetical protein [Chlamydiota bacterium]
AVSSETVKRRMISDLDFIKSVFEVKYAPRAWKQEYNGWDLDAEVENAKNKVLNDPQPTVKNFHVILKELFNSACDYHVGILFYSTEEAYLPFMVKGAQGRYYIVHVDRKKRASSDISVGDEILTFNGRPIAEVIAELREHECGQNTPETDQALAEMLLTARKGDYGTLVPQGGVAITLRKKSSGAIRKVKVLWAYVPEKIPDLGKIGASYKCRALMQQPAEETFEKPLSKNPLFKKMMLCPTWERSLIKKVSNPHGLGARRSFIPALGEKLWQSEEHCSFDAYIFANRSGKKIGYIRIPHYLGDEEEVEEFGEVISYFQRTTDALVVDQINNPGGDVFYLYALASMLTDRPLYTPKHHLMLTQQEVNMAVQLLPLLEQIYDSATARDLFGDTMSGYPVDFEMIRLFRQFCRFVIDEWNQGNLYTKPTFLLGIDDVRPHPHHRYTKPILLLTNALDFSGGDFFPAILQDSQRATVLGTRTAGAGGYVQPTQFPNQTGIMGFHLTGSLAERKNLKPLENLGVVPDIIYDLTPTDMQENHVGYVEAILSGVDSILK